MQHYLQVKNTKGTKLQSIVDPINYRVITGWKIQNQNMDSRRYPSQRKRSIMRSSWKKMEWNQYKRNWQKIAC
jgi:hypothetical protein